MIRRLEGSNSETNSVNGGTGTVGSEMVGRRRFELKHLNSGVVYT